MPKLNQIIAVEKSLKNQANDEITAQYHAIQRAEPLSGLSRTYQPRDDEGEQLPPESTRVQVNVEDVLRKVATQATRLFDVTATKDWSNCDAKADIVVDGKPLLQQVPITYLLFLEKQLTDLHTIVKKLPTLDPASNWHFDESQNAWATDPVKTTKTKKIPRNHVKAEATDRHPAQVDVYHEDVVVGYWTTIKFSGALPAKRIAELLDRVERLQQAVKFARELANSIDVVNREVGSKIFGYLFA